MCIIAYDAADRVTPVQEPFGLALTFAYDDVGNRTGVEDSKSGVTTVVFDAVNRQASEQVGGSGIAAMRFEFAYTDRGEVESLTRYSDLAGTTVVGTTTYDHDAAAVGLPQQDRSSFAATLRRRRSTPKG